MSAKIRKLTLSYPIVIDGRQQRSVFTVDDSEGENKVFVIQEFFDTYRQKMGYKISITKGDHVMLWKEIFPEGCTAEIEYYVK